MNTETRAWHATTILTVRKGGKVVIAGDGQVSIGQTVIKANARKVRTLGTGGVISGFAGATADAFTLFERLETKLEQYPDQLTRACVELAKDWRTDRYLRRLEAMMIVADKATTLVLTGTGDVLEPEIYLMGIGSGGNYALAAARALIDTDLDAEQCSRPRALSGLRHPPTSKRISHALIRSFVAPRRWHRPRSHGRSQPPCELVQRPRRRHLQHRARFGRRLGL